MAASPLEQALEAAHKVAERGGHAVVMALAQRKIKPDTLQRAAAAYREAAELLEAARGLIPARK